MSVSRLSGSALRTALRSVRAILIAVLAACVLAGSVRGVALAAPGGSGAAPLPRAYVVSSVGPLAEVIGARFLAASSDGATAVHLAPRPEGPPVVVATSLQTGHQEVVGIDLAGAHLSDVHAAAVSANGRRVAMLASGSSAEALHLPPGTDPLLRQAIFVRDRLTGSTTWVPTPDLGVPASHLTLDRIVLSEDGSRLVTKIDLPLPRYNGVIDPEGLFIAALAADGSVSTQVVLPEHLAPGTDPAQSDPSLFGFALSGNGAVIVAGVERNFEKFLLRFDATTGGSLPGERAMSADEHNYWLPNVDRTGQRTAFGGAGPAVVVADLLTGPSADVTLPAGVTAPYVSGDGEFGYEDFPQAAAITADGGSVAFLRSGALWTQTVAGGTVPRLASPGLDGRIADPIFGENPIYPDQVRTYATNADARALIFSSTSTAFVAPRGTPNNSLQLYRSVHTDDTAVPTWPAGAALTTEAGATSVSVSWPAATGAVTYSVVVDGQQVAVVAAPATQALVGGLIPGSTVAIAVTARDAEARQSAPLTASVTLADERPPGDAALVAVAGPGAKVQLSWEPAALFGLTGYRVLRDGVTIADLPASDTSYVDTSVAADTVYSYGIAALRGAEQVRLTRDAAVRTPALAVTEAAWHLPRVLPTPFLAPGQPATFALAGAPGFAARAEIIVRTDAGTPAAVTVDLPENEPGTYRGRWTVPTGIVEVASAMLHLADGTGASIDRALTGLPAPVGGLLRAAVDAPRGDASGTRLQVWSPTRVAGAVRVLDGDGIVQVAIAPASDHQLTVIRSDGAPAIPAQAFEAAAGQVVELSLAPSLPASLGVTALRPDGGPLVSTRLSLDTPAGPQAATTDSGGRARFVGLDAGMTVTVRADLSPETVAALGLARSPSQESMLQRGDNALTLAAVPLPKLRLTGTARTEAGAGLVAEIVVSQQVRGSGVAYRTYSDRDGRWQIDVLGETGQPTHVRARYASVVVETVVTIGSQPPAPVELLFPIPLEYVAQPELWVKMLDAAPIRQDGDWRTANHLRAVLTAGGYRTHTVSRVPLRVQPGTTVKFCADGFEVGLPASCAEAVTGSSADVPLMVTLEEKARFTARVLRPDGTPVVEPVRVNFDGSARRAAIFPDGNISVSVPEPGDYTVAISAGGLTFQRAVHALAGRITDLGDVRLGTTTMLDGARSGLVPANDTVLPGGLAELRAEIVYRDATDSGSARLTLPSGVTVPDDGVVLDGVPVPLSVVHEDGRQVVVVPLAAAPSHTLRIFVKTPPDVGRRLPFSMAVTGRAGTEPLGSANVFSGYVSLVSPGRSTDGRLLVSGEAPAGAEVIVRDGDHELTRATAGAGGLWHAVVELGTAGDDVSHHLLRAEATVGGITLRSGGATVVVDRHAAVLESVTMTQSDGRAITFRTVDGVARFPFVFFPGQPVALTARFSGPVEDVRVQLGDRTVPATTVEGEGNTWRADVHARGDDLGDVSVFFTPVIERPPLPVPPLPDVSTFIVNPADLVVHEPEVVGSVRIQRFSAPVPKLGPNATMSGHLVIERLNAFEPTPQDLELASISGAHAFEVAQDGPTVDILERGNVWQVTRRGVIDGARLRSAESDGVTASSVILPARGATELSFNAVTNAEALISAREGGGKYDRISRLLERAQSCSNGPDISHYANEAQRLHNLALSLDAFTAVTTVIGIGLAPVTFGVGTVVAWAVPFIMGKVLEAKLDKQIQALEDAINNDVDCEPNPNKPYFPMPDWRSPVAKPRWIFDPSGIVYEGSLSRPVEGVSATLLEGPTPEGPWHVWQAEEFSQRNPLVTNAAGRYGWDVPPGWWKVLYTKDGYLPAESRPLQVLPPHTDVNVTMVRADLAVVESIAADDDGLTVAFTQPVRADVAGAPGMLVATTPEGAPLGGTWAPVKPEPAPVGHPFAGEQLATAYRFTAERYSGDVKVTVDALVQDHAGRALVSGRSAVLPVSWAGSDTAGPTVRVTSVTQGAVYRLGAVPAAGCETVDDGSGVATPAALTVTGGTPAGVGRFTATCAGAVDQAGNEADPVSVVFTVAYVFEGFSPPVENAALNEAKAGQSIPLKWRVTNASGAPVTNLESAALMVSETSCSIAAATGRSVEANAVDASRLQNLGNGHYQLNWKTPKTFAGSCRMLSVDLGEGPEVTHGARFRFKG